MQSKILKKICAEISEINILQHIKKKKGLYSLSNYV